MSEAAAEANQGGNTSGETPAADEFKPITSQEDLDAMLKDRLARERAKFKDYGDLKAKAAQLDALSEASKSEQDKLTDRITSLENDLEATRLTASRAEIAREFNLTEKQAAALKYAPSVEAAREIAEGLAADASTRKTQGNRVPREGTNSSSATDGDERTFVRSLFASSD